MRDDTITDAAFMTQAVYGHLSSVLGTASARTHSIRLDIIDDRCFDLLELDAPFSEHEIWEAIK